MEKRLVVEKEQSHLWRRCAETDMSSGGVDPFSSSRHCVKQSPFPEVHGRCPSWYLKVTPWDWRDGSAIKTM